MAGFISLSVWLGMLFLFLTSTAQSKYIFTCEDALPMTYDICRELVKRDYCYSELYGKAVRAFCRKSCGICKTGTKGPAVIVGRHVGCFERSKGSALTSVSSQKLPRNDMTVEKCVRYCHTIEAAKFAAFMLGKYCYCGNAYGSDHRDPGIYCTYKCNGSSQQCGGVWPYVSVYEIAVSGGDKSDGKPLETEDLVRILLGSKGESADNSEHMEQNPKKYNY